MIKKYARISRDLLYKHLLNSPRSLICVHIGKCGGSSLRTAVAQSPIVAERFSFVRWDHTRKPLVTSRSKYLIVIRNPISRALSAFNWRYRLVIADGSQKTRFQGEYEVLTRYGSLNDIAEALYKSGELDAAVAREFRTIHHLKEDIAFYLWDLLDQIASDQIFAVVSTEVFDADVERVLGTVSKAREKENRAQTDKAKMELSDTARSNLRQFLDKDYRAIEKLGALHPIEPDVFDRLMS